MILSHQYKFIFLKTNKTAGTSVEIALSKHCGPQDIITPISPRDEKMRHDLGYRGAQNYLAPGAKDSDEQPLFYNHMPASRVRELVGEAVWNDYYKFCFERNPWDRFMSFYYWRIKEEPKTTLSDFLASDAPQLLKTRGLDLYTIDGKVAVDRVCRFESLAEDLEQVRLYLGIPETLDLPRTKTGFRRDKGNYRDALDEQQQNRVAQLFADEIRLFGYRF